MNSQAPKSPSITPGVGYLSNGGRSRYLLEAESTTGFVAWKMADGTILVSVAEQVSIRETPSLTFWSCRGYQETSQAGSIRLLDCHSNDLTELDVRGLADLEYLDCCHNKLTSVSLEGLVELQGLDVANNRLTYLDVRHLNELRVLYCSKNRLKRLELGDPGRLQILESSGNLRRSSKLPL